LGPWPELLARPGLELSERQDRDGVTQYRVEIEIAPGVRQHGYLLLPPARFRGPRPAVLVPFYAPEVSVNYAGPRPYTGQAARYFKDGPPVHRDFAWQLTQRGFVTSRSARPGMTPTSRSCTGRSASRSASTLTWRPTATRRWRSARRSTRRASA
jgi:hypothetical protein